MKHLTSFFPFSTLSIPHTSLSRVVYLGSLVGWILFTFLACDLDVLTEDERERFLNAPEEVRIEDRYYQIQVQLSNDRTSVQSSNSVSIQVRLSKDSLEASDRWPSLDRLWVLNEIDEDRFWTASFDEVSERGGNQLEGTSRGAPSWVMPSYSPWEEAEPLILVVQIKDQSRSYLIKSFL